MAREGVQRTAARACFCPEIRGTFRAVRPDHGARLELKLTQTSAEGVRYALTLFLPEREITTEVLIRVASGALELGDWEGSPPPAWLDAVARALLRTIWRGAASDGEWPRRVTRWRPEPKS